MDVAVALGRIKRLVVVHQDFLIVPVDVVLIVRPVRGDELLVVVGVHLGLGQYDIPDEFLDGPVLAGLQHQLVVDGLEGVAHQLQLLGNLLLGDGGVALLHLLVEQLPQLLVFAARLLVYGLHLGIGKVVLPGLGQLVLDHAQAHKAVHGVLQPGGLLLVGGRVAPEHLGKLQHAVQRALEHALGIGKVAHPHHDGIVCRLRHGRIQRRQQQDQYKAEFSFHRLTAFHRSTISSQI